MRIIVFILSSLIQLVASAAGFLLLLLGMNGYSEKQATPGLILYIAMAVISTPGLGLRSAFMVKRLIERRSFGSTAASVSVVLSSSILGVLILAAGSIAAVILAQIMRGMK